MAKYVRTTEMTDYMLTEISKKRKSEGKQVKTKQDINCEAVSNLYKKEFKGDK